MGIYWPVLLWVLSAIGESSAAYRPVRVKGNETAELPCWELVASDQLHLWLTPDDFIIGPNIPNQSAKYQLSAQGSLIVKSSAKNDSGRYVCYSSAEGQLRKVTVQLDVIDVSYIPEIDDWQSNMIRGVVAAACTCFLLMASCAVHHCRWSEKHQKSDVSANETRKGGGADHDDPLELDETNRSGFQRSGIKNPAYSIDGDIHAQSEL